LGQDPFLFAPNAGAIGPFIAFVTLLEELHPGGGPATGEGGEVVVDLEERLALPALVNDGVEGILGPALRVDALETGVIWHGNPC
jgi:hypothetical protein